MKKIVKKIRSKKYIKHDLNFYEFGNTEMSVPVVITKLLKKAVIDYVADLSIEIRPDWGDTPDDTFNGGISVQLCAGEGNVIQYIDLTKEQLEKFIKLKGKKVFP